MAKKKPKNHENQLSFDDVSGPRHDYSQEVGGEYPFVIANSSPSAHDVQPVDGVSVSLQERADTLARAAEVYANYNKLTIGLGKAAQIPEEVAKLSERYGEGNVPGVVAGAQMNSFYGPAAAEIDIDRPTGEMWMLEGVLKTRELLASGEFSKSEIEAELQPVIVAIRHAIGTEKHGVKAKQRNAVIKVVKKSAAAARKYSADEPK